MSQEQRVRSITERLRKLEDESLAKTAHLLEEGGEAEPDRQFLEFEDDTVDEIADEMNQLVYEAYVDGIKRDKRHDKEWLAVIIAILLGNGKKEQGINKKEPTLPEELHIEVVHKEPTPPKKPSAYVSHKKPASPIKPRIDVEIYNHMNDQGIKVVEATQKVIDHIKSGSRIQFKRAQIEAVTRTTNLYNQGGMTWMQAKQKALDEMAMQNITVFIDRAGRHWQLDTYAEMGIRTGINHASLAGFDASMEQRGIDLVFCSSHFGSCPKCTPWQGRVLSRTGITPNYPTVMDAMNSGLFHPNCMHVLFEYIEGHSTLRNDDSPESAERYRQTQHQRYLERGLRTWKRREAVAITPEARRYSKHFIKKWRDELDRFTRINELPRKRYREKI